MNTDIDPIQSVINLSNMSCDIHWNNIISCFKNFSCKIAFLVQQTTEMKGAKISERFMLMKSWLNMIPSIKLNDQACRGNSQAEQ